MARWHLLSAAGFLQGLDLVPDLVEPGDGMDVELQDPSPDALQVSGILS